jgi:hypothetical protein
MNPTCKLSVRMLLGLALMLAGPLAACAADEQRPPDAVQTGHSPRAHHAHPAATASVDDRVQLMTKELGLDASQQARLKIILLAQRTEMAKVWNDPSVAASLRVGRTRIVSDQTAEGIRGILSAEQREKYIKARRRDAPVGAPGGDVQKWMTPDPG